MPEEPTSLLILADITDELVSTEVIQVDLDAADAFLEDLCVSVGITLADVPDPLPYKVKRLLIAFVCYEKCKQKAGSSDAAFMGQEPTDKWAAKIKLFRDELNELKPQMSLETLTGTSTISPASIGVITLGRG